MPHNLLLLYLERLEAFVQKKVGALVEHFRREILTPERANIRLRLRFENGRLLEISEAVIIRHNRLEWLDYRYHCQDEQNRMLFRYDNAPHFPRLSGFPEHKHLAEDVVSSPRPDIEDVLNEAERND